MDGRPRRHAPPVLLVLVRPRRERRARPADDEPTATAGHGRRPDFGADWDAIEDFVGWQALIWPHDAECFLIDAIHPMLETATSHEVRHDAVRVLEALYRHPGRRGRLSWITLAAGLTAARADARARAVDAVLHFADAGRLMADALARGLADLAGPGTPTRWAGSLKDVAAAEPAGRRPVIDALGAALPEFDPTMRGMHALLELLREELLREQAATPAARSSSLPPQQRGPGARPVTHPRTPPRSAMLPSQSRGPRLPVDARE
jgi:hypothetical protein